jgi:hypothetical protein
LDRAWRAPFRTKSDFARRYADLVALAASEGFLTTRIDVGHWGPDWLITPAGLELLDALRSDQ